MTTNIQIDPADLLDALRAAIHDPNLGAEVAEGLARLLNADADSVAAVRDAKGSLRTAMSWYEEACRGKAEG